jgi:hypothetical protein
VYFSGSLTSELSKLQSDRAKKKLLKHKAYVCDCAVDAYSEYFSQLLEFMRDRELSIDGELRTAMIQYQDLVHVSCENIESALNVRSCVLHA